MRCFHVEKQHVEVHHHAGEPLLLVVEFAKDFHKTQAKTLVAMVYSWIGSGEMHSFAVAGVLPSRPVFASRAHYSDFTVGFTIQIWTISPSGARSPIDHTIFKSIYFFDPNGHRLELAAGTNRPDLEQRLDAVKWDMLNEWAETKRAPRHADWMHDGSEQ